METGATADDGGPSCAPYRRLHRERPGRRAGTSARGASGLSGRGSAGLTTRVTIAGVSFRNADRSSSTSRESAAKIVAPDFSKLPAPTIDNDKAPYVVADFTVDRSAPHDIYSFRVHFRLRREQRRKVDGRP